MTKSLTFAAISGSLRTGSHSTSIADTLHELVPEAVTVTRPGIADIPLYNEDIKDGDTAPQPVRDLAAKLDAADAIIIVSPEYNRGAPGVLKNTIDWLSKEPNKPLAGKPLVVITQSPGATGGLVAQYDLRKQLSVIGAHVQPGFEIAVSRSAERIEDGRLTHDGVRDFIADHLAQLAKTATAEG